MPPLDRVRVSSYSRAPTNIERSFYAQLVDTLIARREELRLTQEDLDRMLGVSDGGVAKWESFTRLPGAFMFVCWCQALEVNLRGEWPEN
jgi:transcriptional regulator with XRE-family HTH domain